MTLKEKLISNITIKICTDTAEPFPFQEGKVICRLNFKRGYLDEFCGPFPFSKQCQK